MHVAPTSMGGGWVGCVIGGYGGGVLGGGYLTFPNLFSTFSYTNLTLGLFQYAPGLIQYCTLPRRHRTKQ